MISDSRPPAAEPSPAWPQVAALGIGQTLAWASSTYLPAVLAGPMSADLGMSRAMVFAAFSCALGVMALLGPAVGRRIDRLGGRPVLVLSNLVLAGGLAALGAAADSAGVFAAWALIGIGMALGLYDAAFAALVRQHGLAARGPITGITLLGGFASTVGWPLTAWLIACGDWRLACFAWAAAHLLIALPLNYRFIPPGRTDDRGAPEAGTAPPAAVGRRDFFLLAVFGAATAFVTSAMAAHLPGLLANLGLAATAAVAAAALVGPAQVAARLGEFFAARRWRPHPLATAGLATALHPLGGLCLLAAGGVPGMAAAFALLHGAGNGMITIAKGTLPLFLFGPRGYGALQGRLAVAQRGAQAVAPYLFALLLEQGGAAAGLGVTVGLSLLALLALAGLQAEHGKPL